MHDNSTVILIGEEVYMLFKKFPVHCLCYIHVCVATQPILSTTKILKFCMVLHSYSNKYRWIHIVNRLCFRYEMNVGHVNIE